MQKFLYGFTCVVKVDVLAGFKVDEIVWDRKCSKNLVDWPSSAVVSFGLHVLICLINMFAVVLYVLVEPDKVYNILIFFRLFFWSLLLSFHCATQRICMHRFLSFSQFCRIFWPECTHSLGKCKGLSPIFIKHFLIKFIFSFLFFFLALLCDLFEKF